MRLPRLPLLLLALLSLPAATSARTEADRGAVWQRFERTLPIEVEAANPFDPDQVRVHAELRRPGGQRVLVDAFVYRPYERELLASGREALTPTGPLSWCVRFTPTRPGLWRWRWVRRTPVGEETGPWRRLRVGANRDPSRHGFLRPSEDPRYLRFDDGSGFFAVGTNLGWSGAGGSFDFERWLDRLAEQGANTIRVWMPRWDTGLFYPPAQLEDWRDRMDRAWRLDRLMEMAEERGIHVVLVLLNHGAFSLDFNAGWHLNPFNAALGGPLDDPLEVWTDPEAKRILHNLFRYAVARWGYATNLLSWELWNEANLTARASPVGLPVGLPLADVTDWHREMAHLLREHDPNDHLVSTSSSDTLEVIFGAGLPPAMHTLAPVYALPGIDFAQLHLYQLNAVSFPGLFGATVPNRRSAAAGRPVLVSEAGVDFRGPAETLAKDPQGEGFHDLLWSGLVSGGFGTGMPWWWDNVTEPEDRWFHWGPLAQVTRGVAFHREGFALAELPVVAPPRDVRAHALTGTDTAIVWVKNHDHEFFHPDRGTVVGGQLALPGLAPGRWRLRWIDPWSGALLEERVVRVDDGIAPETWVVPDFRRDVALRADRLPALPSWARWLFAGLGGDG